jgi:hypothetical protein
MLGRLAVLTMLLLGATGARADATLNQLRAEAARAEVMGFERTTRAETQTDDGPVISTQMDRFNPRAPAARQWTLLSVDGRKPTAKEIAEHRKRVTSFPVPGFYRLSAVLAGEPVRLTDAQGRTVYRWEKLPRGALPTPGPDVSERMAAEAVVEKVGGRAMFSRVRIYAPRPFPIMAVAKMKAFDLINLYQPGAGGTPFLMSQTSLTDVSAPFGRGGRQTSQISFRPI